MNDVRLVVFDLDGTLVDSMGAFADQAAKLMSIHYGMDYKTGYSKYVQTSGLPFRQQLDFLFPRDSRNDLVARRFEAWKLEVIDDTSFRPGVEDMFDGLHGLGVRIAISSNNLQQNVDYISQKFPRQVDTVLGFRGNGFHKGMPHFSWLADNLQCRRSELVFVGDSLNDCHIALRCKVPFVAFPTTFSLEEFLNVDPDVAHVDPITGIVDWVRERRSSAPTHQIPTIDADLQIAGAKDFRYS